MKLFILILFTFSLHCVSAQDLIRQIPAIRTTLPVKIDGFVNEPAWAVAASIDKLVQQRPEFGKPEEEKNKTQAWIMYDDNAVYFGGFNHETKRDSISTELGGRDKSGINDYIGIVFDPYRDQINGVGFFVTALGEQFDAKYSLNDEDESWSTVYQTATVISDSGWSFEMRIPYSALRFSKNKIQDWGINIIRKRTKIGHQYTWNPINPNKFGLISQNGVWTNIENIKSPLRLSFSPYFSSYLDYSPDINGRQQKSTSVNGGMDVKYGISKGFTLDMTLIPDFGQVQSDDQVLNLSPFEIRYNENRSFFTEGTELFNKGNFFYSRRVGGQPVNGYLIYNELDKKSTILKNPIETKLVNATKISGRTSKGLGIGVFNAITKPQYSILLDSNQVDYKFETSPWTNYNIIVLDQTMKYNSSITFVNTNVLRSGTTYDANLTAGLFDIYDKKVDWNIWGKLANSRLSGEPYKKTLSGYNYELNFGKFRGPFNFELHQHVADDKFEQNELGFFNNNNYSNFGGTAWYKINKPKSFYNQLSFNVSGTYSMRYKPRQYQYLAIFLNANGQLKNLWSIKFFGNINPEQQDFYEARMEGKKFRTPGSWRAGLFINTNQAKKYSAAVDFSRRTSPKYNAYMHEFNISNRYRFNDQFNVALSTSTGYTKNDVGYATASFFGLRDRQTVQNTLSLKYNFNIKMGLTFRTRHYWSRVKYSRFFNLKEDGYLEELAGGISVNPDNNVNIFNIDMIYTWEFAQGSFINIAWKNAGFVYNQDIKEKYYSNLSETLQSPHQNNLSLKVIYYLDYLTFRNRKKK